MQLAATQRAHPPPVPPRPSRQVVAEALKKSPRPPCPTRQAPAPPANQRPWRLEEQQKQEASAGRTIVYESSQMARTELNGKEEPCPAKRPVSRDFSKDQQVKPVNGRDHREVRIDDTSKRKEEENNRQDGNNSDEQCDGPESPAGRTSESSCSSGSERKRKKCHNVTFKEEAVESTVSVIDSSGTIARSTDKCATVVVIDDATAPSSRLSSSSQEEHDTRIQRQDWLEAGVRYSSTKITLPAAEELSSGGGGVLVNGFDREMEEGETSSRLEFADLDFSSIIERIAMSSLQGLPPLPRSLSGFNLNGAGLVVEPPPPPPARSTSKASQRSAKTPTSTTSSQGSRPSPQGRQLTTLDTQLAILRREMFGLRQLDLSLLSQLWSLNESIQEFRQLLQEQEDRAPSPSPSSEEGDDTSYGGGPTQPPPPPRRPAPSTPHHHHHHHRAARPLTRSSKLPPSDESPSSEEYGAV